VTPSPTSPSEPDPNHAADSKVRELFDAASELPVGERKGFLQRFATDPGLRDRVEALLAHHDGNDGFLSTPAAEVTALAELSHTGRHDAMIGFRLGKYTIREVLGAGGMGLVYRAEQDSPQRTVALKVVRSYFAGPELLRRFRHEAEALGRLRHPCIAQIFEAGTAPDPNGKETPFFAMELVSGRPLLEAAANLNIRERLALFAAVCDGVQHAHQRGVIHRDLKPGNILVEESDSATSTMTSLRADTTSPADAGVRGMHPKILDFGVARLTSDDAGATRSVTSTGQVIGTIPYMSPEQVRGDIGQLDTRSDVYSLGVILCELLTGRLPYELIGKSIPEAARIITDAEPSIPHAHDRALKGDVETILFKALEKEPQRRYQSAAELAGDIRRYLADLPIVARPATATYQLRKFARRHKGLVAGVAGIILALGAGVIGTTVGLFRAAVARDLAQQREIDARQAQMLAEQRERQANLETRKARRAVDFLAQMLTGADPDLTEGREVTVRELLDHAALGVETELADEPDVLLAARSAIARTYLAIGSPEKSIEHYEPVLDLARGIYGEESLEAAEILHQLSRAESERKNWRAAIDLGAQSLAVYINRRAGDGAGAGRTCATLAGAYIALGDMPNGEVMARRAFEIAAANDRHESLAEAAGLLGTILQRVGGPTAAREAEELIRLRLAIFNSLRGPLHSSVIEAKSDLGWFYVGERRTPEAYPLLEEAEAGYLALYGPNHRKTLNATVLRGSAYQAGGDLERSKTVLSGAVDALRENLPDSSELGTATWRLGVTLMRTKEYPEAEASLRESVRIREKIGDARLSGSYSNLGSVLLIQGKTDEAIEWQQKAIEARRKTGSLLSDFGTLLNNYAVSLTKAKRYEEAEAAFRESIEYDRKVRPNHPLNGLNLRPYAEMLQLVGRSSEAEPIAREALALLQTQSQPEQARAATVLATILDSLGKTDEAMQVRTAHKLQPPAK